MRTTLATLIVIAAVSVPTEEAHAGGWVQAPGAYYLKVWDRALIGSGVYRADGETFTGPSYMDHQVSVYAEAGVTEELTLLAALTPFGRARVDGRTTTYMGPMVVGTRLGLLRGSVPLALEFHYGVEPGVGRTLYEVEDAENGVVRYDPSVFNHRTELQLQVGRGFRIRQSNAWFSASLGARINTEYREALTAFVQVGVMPGRFVMDLHFQAYEPFFAELEETNIAGVGDTRYLGFGLSVGVRLTDHVGLSLGFEGVLYAQSNAATPSLLLALEAKGS